VEGMRPPATSARRQAGRPVWRDACDEESAGDGQEVFASSHIFPKPTRMLDATQRVDVLEFELMSEIMVSLDRDVAEQLVKRIKHPFHVNVGSEAAFQKFLVALESALQPGDVSPNFRRLVAVGLHGAWTSEDDADALRMRADRRPWREVAEELGRSVYAVKARLRKLETRRKSRRERED
jgi:hypothetical protein